MKFNKPTESNTTEIPINDYRLNFSFLDLQKLAFKKISEVSQKASQSENINHQEAALIIKRLIDILKITLADEEPDLLVTGEDDRDRVDLSF